MRRPERPLLSDLRRHPGWLRVLLHLRIRTGTGRTPLRRFVAFYLDSRRELRVEDSEPRLGNKTDRQGSISEELTQNFWPCDIILRDQGEPCPWVGLLLLDPKNIYNL